MCVLSFLALCGAGLCASSRAPFAAGHFAEWKSVSACGQCTGSCGFLCSHNGEGVVNSKYAFNDSDRGEAAEQGRGIVRAACTARCLCTLVRQRQRSVIDLGAGCGADDTHRAHCHSPIIACIAFMRLGNVSTGSLGLKTPGSIELCIWLNFHVCGFDIASKLVTGVLRNLNVYNRRVYHVNQIASIYLNKRQIKFSLGLTNQNMCQNVLSGGYICLIILFV